ncbi:cobalamin-binding protein [Stagnimonas aquatica]|uniref:Cobalamin-binding protein n=1 Tax=Stagnimonas aquatica TaxID=2689987 RepID=A0A3N0V2P3_9GAMM|nr:cobalamin-binding protein [Stagnimonas aquatica]
MFSAGLASAGERVVALGPHLAELVCAAGGCEPLVGVIAYSDFPEAVRRLPVVGDASQVNLEVLLSLRPSLVLAWDGGTSPTTIARLRRLGLRVEPVRVESLEDVATALERIGAWTGHPQAASAAARDYRQRLQNLRQRYAAAAPLRVFYQIETAPAYTVNRASPISQAITLCGGLNLFAGLPTLAAPVSDEAVLAAQPEVVIHGERDGAEVRAYWARFPQAPVQVRQQIYAVNSDLLTRAGPRLIDGAEQLCAALDRARRPRQ